MDEGQRAPLAATWGEPHPSREALRADDRQMSKWTVVIRDPTLATGLLAPALPVAHSACPADRRSCNSRKGGVAARRLTLALALKRGQTATRFN